MKRSSNEQSIKQVIDRLLEVYKLQGKYNEVSVVNSWEEIMGKTIANHTKDIYIKNRKLFVKLDSAVLREELSYGREKIAEMLNKVAGKVVIDDVVLM